MNNCKSREWLKQKCYLNEKWRIIEKSFVDNMFNNLFINRKFRKLHLYKEALDCILANLIYHGRKDKPLSKPIPLYYKHCNFLTDTIVNNIIKILVANDYCSYWAGHYNVRFPQNSQSAKLFPTHKIMNNFLHINNIKPKEFIRLNKVVKGRKVDVVYKKTWWTDKMVKDITTINNNLKTASVYFNYQNYNTRFKYEHEFDGQIENLLNSNHIQLMPNDSTASDDDVLWFETIYGSELYLNNEYTFRINNDSLYLFRQFNRNDFIYGGRFFTPMFQSIPSTDRKSITINGEETIELDYSGHHIRMLYHREGLEFDGEPYVYPKSALEHEDDRNVHKAIAMIAINAVDRNQAIGAVFNKLKKDNKFASDLPTFKELSGYYDDFLNYHKRINKYVSADIGIKLQRQDSDIMNDILVSLAKEGIVALPVHDSVIVAKQHKDILKETMISKYNQHLKYNPIVS